MSTTTVDGFVEVLERSELLTEDQLAEVREQVDSTGDVKAAAISLIQKQLLTTWQAKLILAGRHTFKLGKYVLCDRLGEEDSGDLYLAKHVQLQRTVAIKTLTREVTKDPTRLKSFLVEAREIAKLDHRNITHLFDINSDSDRYFLVMEHIEGQTLAKMVEEDGPIDRNIVAGYVRQAADALAHAHEKGILHRRVNPANLIVDNNGTVKLLNLGMSRLLGQEDKDNEATMDGEFMAPEQKSSGEIDIRTDIYGLGATALYLFTGRLPSSIQQGPQSVLEKILRKMTAARPEDRFNSAQQVSKFLAKWIEENPAVVPESETEEEVPLAEAAEAEEGFPGISIDTGSKNRVNNAKPVEQKPAANGDGRSNDSSKPGKPPVKNSSSSEDGFLGLDSGASLNSPVSPFAQKANAKKTSEVGEKKKSKIPTVAIVGIVGAGLATLLLFGTVVGVAYWLLSGSDNQLAQNDTSAVVNSNQTGSSDAQSTSANVSASEASDENNEPEEGDPDDLPPLGGYPMPVNVNDEAAGDVEPPKVTDDESVTTESANGGGDTPKPPAPNPEPKNEPKPNPAPPNATPPKPMPPKPATPKKPANAFADLQKKKAVDIPVVGAEGEEPLDKVVQVGNVNLGPSDFLEVRLIGGDQVHKSKKVFEIRNGLGGTSLRDFEIFLTGPKDSNDQELLVAKLWFDQKQMKFQWTDQAPKDPSCNYLRNCTIGLLTGASAVDVKLRKPVKLEPIALDFEKGASGETSAPKLDWLPDPSTVRVAVEFVTAKNLPNRFDPGNEFAGVKGSANILLGGELILAGGNRMHTSSIKLESTVGRSMQVDATLYVNYPGRGKKLYTPSRYVEKKLDSLLAELNQNKSVLANYLVAYSKITDNKQKELFNQNLLRQTGIVNLSQAIKDLDTMLNEYGKLKSQYVEQVKNSKIKVRIYHTVGDAASGEYQVVLAE